MSIFVGMCIFMSAAKEMWLVKFFYSNIIGTKDLGKVLVSI